MNGLIPFGKFGKTHGTQGEVRFWPYNAETEALKKGLVLVLDDIPRDPKGEPLVAQELKVESVRGSDRHFILRLKYVASREDAALLTNLTCSISREVLPKTDPDEWYQSDLIGLPVFTDEAHGREEIGRVAGFIDTPGPFEVMAVEGPRLNGRVLVLWRDEIVKEVDLQTGIVLAEFASWAPEGEELK